MFKRILSLALIAVMCFSFTSFASSGKTEVSARSYAPLLKSLGISDDQTLSASDITRMTFLKSALKLLGEDAVFTGGVENEISDVPSGSDNYKYVNFAMNAGVISKSAQFRPNDSVNYNEAIKMLVCILGYQTIAEAIGGYPTGYSKVASELDLNDGISSAVQTIGAEEYITLMINTLNASPAKVSQIVDGNAEISINTGAPLMELSFNLYKGEGLVDATTVTSIYSLSTLGKNEVRIDGTVYECDPSLSSEMLGVNAEYYYESKSGSNYKKIVFMTPVADSNNIWVFDGESLEDTRFSGNVFEYFEESGNQKSVKISGTASYIYNGVIKGKSEVNLNPVNGRIVLIDNDSDKIADIVKILDFKSSVVNGCSASGDVISLKNGEKLEFDFDEDYVSVNMYGEVADMTDIMAGRVISYYVSSFGEGKVAEIYVSDKVVTGIAEEMSADTVTVGEETFKYTSAHSNLIKLGVNQKFCIDAFGVVADVTSLDDVYVYGWLYGAITEGMGKIKVKIFTENDRWVELYLADSVRTENGKLDKEEWFKLSLPRQLVRYKVNSEAFVTEIMCAKSTERWSEDEKTLIAQDAFRLSLSLKNTPYRYSTTSFEDKVYFGNCANIFYVPEDESYIDGYDIISITKNFKQDSAVSGVQAYDMDIFGNPGALIIRHPGLSRSYADFMIFDRVSRTTNADGDETYALCGTFKGYEIKFNTFGIASSELDFNKGDILKINFNTDGEVTSAVKLFDIKSDINRNFLNGALYSNDGYICAEVVDVDLSLKRVVLDYGDATGIFAILANDAIVFDTDTEECSTGSLASLTPGTKIFARMEYLRLMNIVVIE